MTGGIGSGKSEALAAFARLGAKVLSTDTIVHDLYADPSVVRAVIDRWGPEIAPHGAIDRTAVAERAFGDDEDRVWLESLLWPRVGDRMLAWRDAERAKEPAPVALVVEVPLLFEAGLEGAFDTTIAIVADEDVRAGRAAARGHASVDERTARQLGQDEKAELADHVVANSGSIAELEHKLSELLDKLRR